MEEQNEEAGMKRRKNPLIVSGVILTVILGYFTIMSLMAPGRKLDSIRLKYGPEESSENKIDERLYRDSSYMVLLKEKSYLQARTSMAETDSVYMTLNLSDSTANLEISGVTVHSVRINSYRVSGILRRTDEYAISSMLSSPMNIVSDLATIKKEPLMIKMAPKDTSEFKPDIIPDTSDYEPVNYILGMDNGIRIYVYQTTDTLRSDKRQLFFFDLRDRFRTTWSYMKSMAMLRVPEYHPFIKIRLPKADAKILYRAVPRKGQIAVYT
ncbi:MAG: hypothetical protein RBS38_10180 [Bacteroidales bacterium]|jgi:hypothetical protein|nr:hypothetical protein [Bacteroidales bacterium]